MWEGVLTFLQDVVALCESDEVGYVDGILIDECHVVVMIGKGAVEVVTHAFFIQAFNLDRIISGSPKSPIVTLLQNYSDPWFYYHVIEIAQSHEASSPKEMHSPLECEVKGAFLKSELIPLRDYLFRYDRGAFWMVDWELYSIFGSYRHSKWIRTFLSPLVSSRKLYCLLHGLPKDLVMQVSDAFPILSHFHLSSILSSRSCTQTIFSIHLSSLMTTLSGTSSKIASFQSKRRRKLFHRYPASLPR